ncbi:MAG: PQQ-binding-like beta-propeller repeat protein [Candidatus Sumerlaeota bacterium]|nr:PQQ-binding-like beta-propeller repeat protein [Candidatus Sumerlaeota bacterium]
MKSTIVSRWTVCLCALVCLLGAVVGFAEDWPTYQHDAARSGVSAESLAAPLTQLWSYKAPFPPSPAWSPEPNRKLEGKQLLNRVAFDEAFQVAVAGGTLYFGSSSDNTVRALDAASGKEQWTFFTEGPVRFSPMVVDGKCYFGSDDGCAYCVDAKDGKLLWKVSPAPNGERILGNGYMVSRWPLRTGVLVDGGVAYFAAGVFPHEGLMLCAVDAKDGKFLWKNDTIAERSAGQLDFSPQGYLLASAKEIFVPSGRGMPAAFHRDDGDWLVQPRLGWRDAAAGGIVGGVYALLADGQIYTGTHLIVAVNQETGKSGFAWFPGRRLVISGDDAYMATGTEIAGVNRPAYAEASRELPKQYAEKVKANKTANKAKKAEAAGEPAPTGAGAKAAGGKGGAKKAGKKAGAKPAASKPAAENAAAAKPAAEDSDAEEPGEEAAASAEKAPQAAQQQLEETKQKLADAQARLRNLAAAGKTTTAEFKEASQDCQECEAQLEAIQKTLAAEQAKFDQIATQSEQAQAAAKAQGKPDLQTAVRWRVPSSCEASMILAGKRDGASACLLVAGGDGEVSAFDAATGAPAWSAKVNGRASGLAVSGGRLYVSTDKGEILCFGPAGQAPAAAPQAKPVENPYPADALTPVYAESAKAIVKNAGVTEGFALVLGGEASRLAYELAKATDLRIYAIESDAAKVDAARKALSAAGLYGGRVCVDQGDPSKLPYANYFANLIVCDSAIANGQLPADPGAIARCLRPCGGVACVGIPKGAPPAARQSLDEAALSKWIEGLGFGRCSVITDPEEGGKWAVMKRPALPGAGKWTSEYAEPGNTACGDDQIVRAPLRLLWYGEPGQTDMINRHNKAPAPVSMNGRMFVQGAGVVMAYDAYNGLLLWKRDMPEASRDRMVAEPGNLALSDDSLFVGTAKECVRLDQATGEPKNTYPLPAAPDGQPHQWVYMAYADGKVFGSMAPPTAAGANAPPESDAVFALDADSGKLAWMHRGQNIMDLTIALGEGRMFFVDSSIREEQRQALLGQDKAPLKDLTAEEQQKAEAALKKLDARMATALDLKTGKAVWEKPVEVTNISHVGIGGGELCAAYSNGALALYGANANAHHWEQFMAGEFSRRRIEVLNAMDGSVLWAKDCNYRHRPLVVGPWIMAEPWAFDLKTGEQRMRPQPFTGEPSVWEFYRPGHHCGAVSANVNTLFMRSGFTSYYDLAGDSGIEHFSGHRLGCWINAVAANGLMLAPEAAAGCTCLFSVVCTIAMEPCEQQQSWSIYGAPGPNLPVKTMAVNFGAPGDRKAKDGTEWFAYPRPGLPAKNAAMGFSFTIDQEFAEGGKDYCLNNASLNIQGTAVPWVYASGTEGLKRCIIPLQDPGGAPERYTVRLHFAEIDPTLAGSRVFDVSLQGQTVAKGMNIARDAGGVAKALVKEFKGVQVADSLTLELAGANAQAPPLLSGIEIAREGASGQAVASVK